MTWRIKQLEERKQALVSQSDAILERAAKDGDRELTDDEVKVIETNTADLTKLAAKLKREIDLAEFAKTNPVSDEPAERWPGQLPASATKVGNPKAAFEADPKKGFANHRDFLMAVLNNSDRPSREARDERLRFLATAGSDEQGGYSDPYGGFLVPVGFAPNLMQMTPEEDPIGGRTTQVPMSAPKIEVLARVDKNHSTSVSGGLTVCRRAETQTQAASRMEMEKIGMTAYSLFGLAYATEEILTDSPISFAALLEAGFRDQFTSHLIDERLNGTGVGELEGIINSDCLVSITKETGQAADTIVWQNILKMRARAWRYGQCVWMANHDCLPQLMSLVMPIGTGGVPLWQTSAREGEPDTILGRPLIVTEYCKTVGDKGDLLCCNWSQYLEGTYQALQSAESVHVRFVNHERTFKFWLRNAGKCWWRSPLTPKNSTATLSPFVSLNARA